MNESNTITAGWVQGTAASMPPEKVDGWLDQLGYKEDEIKSKGEKK